MKYFGWLLAGSLVTVGLVACTSDTEEEETDAGTAGSGGAVDGGTGGGGGTTATGGTSQGGTGGGATGGAAGSAAGAAGAAGASGMGGQGGAPACALMGGDPTCDACMETNCLSGCIACAAEPECLALNVCYDGCTDAGCFDTCDTDHPDGLTLMNAFQDCLFASCQTECGM